MVNSNIQDINFSGHKQINNMRSNLSRIQSSQKQKTLHKEFSHKNLGNRVQISRSPFPLSSLQTNGPVSGRAISAINKSPIHSDINTQEIGSRISQSLVNAHHNIDNKNNSRHLISQLGLSMTSSDMLKSRKNKIFQDPDSIEFKLPELADYYYKKDQHTQITMNRIVSNSHSEDNRVNNNNQNSFFDFTVMNTKGETNLLESLKIKKTQSISNQNQIYIQQKLSDNATHNQTNSNTQKNSYLTQQNQNEKKGVQIQQIKPRLTSLYYVIALLFVMIGALIIVIR